MKRALILLLISALTLTLMACGGDTPTTGSTDANLEATGTTGVTEPTSSATEPTESTAPTEPEPTDPPGPVKPEVPAEPTDPANLVTEARTEAPCYIPDLFNPTGGYGPPTILFDLPQECFPGMEITFDLKADYAFLGGSNRRDTVEAMENGKGMSISWWDYQEMQAVVDAGGSTFIEVIIRADGYIVGYGIYEIGTDGHYYASMRAESVIFPVIDGVLQYSTEEYVAEKIAELKQVITPLDVDAKLEEEEAYLIAYWENYWNNFYAERTPVESDTIHVTASVDLFSKDPEAAGNALVQILEEQPIHSSGLYEAYVYGSELYPEIHLSPSIYHKLGVDYGQFTYEVSTNYSGLYDTDGVFQGNHFFPNTGNFRWRGPQEWPEGTADTVEQPQQIWIDVVIRSREHIVGFIVFQIVPMDGEPEGYSLQYHYSEVYDFVDDRFQAITEEFVRNRIDACHSIFGEE